MYLKFRTTIPGILFFLSLLVFGCQSNSSNAKPNFIIILLDDAGYADFSFNGCTEWETPNIDRLARMGVVFTDAHVSATVCSPSRAGLMTGRYQQRFGHECNSPRHGFGMDTTETTLADALKTAGYKTVAIGKWHLGAGEAHHPNNRGFDEFYGFIEGSRSYFYEPLKHDKPGDFHSMQLNQKQVKFDGYLTDVLTDSTLQYIDKFKDGPFFIYYAPNAVHGPMHAKVEHLEKFKDSPRPILAAMTYSIDENIGRITDKLEAEELLDNTVLFFLSDNGGVFRKQNCADNTPLKGEKGNKFEGGHRVPFFITYSGKIKGNRSYDGLTSALDIFATCIAEAGIEKTPGKPLDGVNLIPFISGEAMNNPPHEYLYWRKDYEAAVRSAGSKLIRVQQHGSVLYNMDNDIGEKHNLSETDTMTYNKLEQLLLEWEQGLVQPLWKEGIGWETVNSEIHRALMLNETPKYRSPADLKKMKK